MPKLTNNQSQQKPPDVPQTPGQPITITTRTCVITTVTMALSTWTWQRTHADLYLTLITGLGAYSSLDRWIRA